MQHNYWLYAVLDKIINENKDIQSIVEIGTGCGALTSFFGLWGINLDIPVLSIDIQPDFYNQKILNFLGVNLLVADEFEQTTIDKILETINHKKALLYCDGGNKTKEFLIFSQLLPLNSIVAVHDLGVEFNPELAVKELNIDILEPYKLEYWNELNIQLAIFKRK